MTVSEAYLAPLTECLTPEVAKRIIDFRPDSRAEQRLEYLRERANEGQLTDEEGHEYQEFVDMLDFVGLLKAHARARLQPPKP